MANRRWLPSNYLDEVIPPPRATPDAWIVTLPDGAYALAAEWENDEERSPQPLKDGDVVEFYWTEDHGKAEFSINADRTWTCSIQEPEAPEGGELLVAVEHDWETMCHGLREFAESMLDLMAPDTEETIIFYSWSRKSVPFVFRGGRFHQTDKAQPSEIQIEERPHAPD